MLSLHREDGLASARRSLKSTIVTIVSLNRVMASCVVDVPIGCISVAPTAVRENASPDPKNKTQVYPSSRLFPEGFPVRHFVVEWVGAHGLLRGGVFGKHRAT